MDMQYLNFAFGDEIRGLIVALKILVYVITAFVTASSIGHIIGGIRQ